MIVLFGGLAIYGSIAGGKGPGGNSHNPMAQKVHVDETTGCEWAVNSFDSKDLPAVKAIFAYIDKTMSDHESDIGGRMMKRLSKDGHDKMTSDPIGLCDLHRDQTLHDEVLKVYDLFDTMQKSTGTN